MLVAETWLHFIVVAAIRPVGERLSFCHCECSAALTQRFEMGEVTTISMKVRLMAHAPIVMKNSGRD